MHAARENADQDNFGCALVPLDDLMRDARERALEIARVEDRRGGFEIQILRLPRGSEGRAKEKLAARSARAIEFCTVSAPLRASQDPLLKGFEALYLSERGI
jgi:hypothetical protein